MTADIEIPYIENDFDVCDFQNKSWRELVTVKRYWSGTIAPEGRWFRAALLWSNNFLYVRHRASISEPLIIDQNPVLDKKTNGLWNRDVFEIFIAPNPKQKDHYFEFEVAPTGEWIDLEIKHLLDKRKTNFEYESRYEVAARFDEIVETTMKIPWAAFGKKASVGEHWYGNIMRAMGRKESRGYLAWRATETDVPNFHVPARFGKFIFVANEGHKED